MTSLEIVQIVSIIVSGVVALGGFFGLAIYFSERARYKAGKKNRKEQAREDAEEERKNENLRKIIREENASIKADTKEIKEDLAANTKGTVTILRNDMKKSLDYCKRQGYASSNDRANWHELYKTYAELGGNHFKEFVDAWKAEFDALPLAPVEKKKLNEDK